MRISTLCDDPGYMPGIFGVRVFLDGVEVCKVFTADEEKRLIVQADLDEQGRIQIDQGSTGVRMITRHGHVRIEVPPQLEARLVRTAVKAPNVAIKPRR